MKIKLLLFGILFVFAACEESGEEVVTPPQVVRVVNKFLSGTYHFELLRSDGKLDSLGLFSITKVTFTVSPGEGGLLIGTWEYGETIANIPEVDQGISTLDKERMNIYKGLEIIFSMDTTGQLVELLNYQDCQHQLYERSKNAFPGGEMSQSEREKVWSELRPTYSTPLMLLNSYFPEVMLYFGNHDQTLRPGEVQSSYCLNNRFLNGVDLPAKCRVSYKKHDNNYAYIIYESKVSPEKIDTIVRTHYQALSKKFARSFDLNNLPVFEFYTNDQIRYDYLHNRIVFVESDLFVQAGDQFQINSIQLKLK